MCHCNESPNSNSATVGMIQRAVLAKSAMNKNGIIFNGEIRWCPEYNIAPSPKIPTNGIIK